MKNFTRIAALLCTLSGALGFLIAADAIYRHLRELAGFCIVLGAALWLTAWFSLQLQERIEDPERPSIGPPDCDYIQHDTASMEKHLLSHKGGIQ